MNALRANFLGTDFRPVGLSAGSRALVRVVDDLEWITDRVKDQAGPALGDMQRTRRSGYFGAAARVLREHPARPTGRPSRAELEAALDRTCGRWRAAATAKTSTGILGAHDDETAVDDRARLADPPRPSPRQSARPGG